MRKIKKLNKQLDLRHKSHSAEDLQELITRYTDNKIVDAFRIMYPRVSKKIDELKNKPDEDALNESKTIYTNAFYDDNVMHKAFMALYPDVKENKPMPEIENKNKVMNDYIRKQAGIPVKENNPDTDADKEDKNMNELIRNSYKSTNQELRDLLFKKSK